MYTPIMVDLYSQDV